MCSQPRNCRFRTKASPPRAYTTFDGLTINLKLFQHDDKDWIALAAAGSGKTAAEAKKLNDRASHWVYAIPSYKAK